MNKFTIAIVVVLVLVIGVAVYLYSPITPRKTPMQDETVGKEKWKLINEAWGYSLQYPQDFSIKGVVENPALAYTLRYPDDFTVDDSYGAIVVLRGSKFLFNIQAIIKPYDVTLDKWVAENGFAFASASCGKERIIAKRMGNYDVKQCENVLSEMGVDTRYITTALFFTSSKERVMNIISPLPVSISDQEKATYHELLDSIVSSLDLSLEPTYEFKNWQEYSNKEWGARILYPPQFTIKTQQKDFTKRKDYPQSGDETHFIHPVGPTILAMRPVANLEEAIQDLKSRNIVYSIEGIDRSSVQMSPAFKGMLVKIIYNKCLDGKCPQPPDDKDLLTAVVIQTSKGMLLLKPMTMLDLIHDKEAYFMLLTLKQAP